jgi:DNA polymerase-1
MPEKLYLIDGHALAYRTFFAITRGSTGGFVTRSGEPTAGVFGFTSVLLRLLDQEAPDYLAVAFDVGRTFRDDLFAEYKGTREKMPDELRVQIERIRQLVDAFNIPRLELDGYEADDVIGSVARKAAQDGLGVKIITGDRDLLQLVDSRIVVNLPGKSLAEARDYYAEDVKEYMGVLPGQIVDLKALVGDKSDNIPGVAGIGDKTAAGLLEKYGTLDEIYTHLGELPAGVQKKLLTGRDSATLSRTLATIVTDLDIPLDLEQARPDRFDPERIEAIFRELEFRSLITKLIELEKRYGKTGAAPAQTAAQSKGRQLDLFGAAAPGSEAPAKVTLAAPEAPGTGTPGTGAPGANAAVIVDTPEALADLVQRLEKAELIVFDTETTGTDPMQAEPVGISLAIGPETGYYIPLGHNQGRQLGVSEVIEALRGPFTNPNIPKAGHNLKYDYIVLRRLGLDAAPLGFDTMIAEWVTNPGSHNLGLKNLAWVRQGVQMTHIEELIGKGKKQITMAEAPIPAAGAYAAADARITLGLIPELRGEMDMRQAGPLFREIEMPLVRVLAEMEMAGVALDAAYLQAMSAELATRLMQIEADIYSLADGAFNINSTQQLSEVLFKRLGLTPPDRAAKTASGFYSTSAEVLEFLRGQHPVVDQVLAYRELTKLKSTYIDALPLEVNPRTGRVHTSYNQTGSVTGRIASSEPNLQNIPIRTELGRQVRNAFIASPGNILLSVDYSQVELRIVAHMSGDPAMLETFRAGLDIHTATAAAIYGVGLEAVTKEMRRRAKSINFGLIYGMSAFGLTRVTDLTLAEAEDFVQAYFRQFPGVKTYLDGMRRLAAEQGYVETLLGRRRYFPGLKTQTDRNIRNREEREAINAPIQGTAADIMKIAMLGVPPALKAAGLSGRMLLQVHDELVLEIPPAELETTARLVQRVMEEAYALDAPLRTEARYGPNWGMMTVMGDV